MMVSLLAAKPGQRPNAKSIAAALFIGSIIGEYKAKVNNKIP